MGTILENGAVNRNRGPDVGQGINILFLEADLKALIEIEGCLINPDQITHISGDGVVSKNTTVHFVGGGYQRFEGMDKKDFVLWLTVFHKGYRSLETPQRYEFVE